MKDENSNEENGKTIFQTITDISNFPHSPNGNDEGYFQYKDKFRNFILEENIININSNDEFRAQLLHSMDIKISSQLDNVIYKLIPNISKSSLLQNKLNFFFFQFLNIIQSCKKNLIPDSSCNYFETCKISISNIVIQQYIKKLINEIKEIDKKIYISNYMNRKGYTFVINPNCTMATRKRLRRSADEIDRMYKCPISNCRKEYGFN